MPHPHIQTNTVLAECIKNKETMVKNRVTLRRRWRYVENLNVYNLQFFSSPSLLCFSPALKAPTHAGEAVMYIQGCNYSNCKTDNHLHQFEALLSSN